MNEAEVNKQIQQMVHFIRQEAEEKANEIAVSTEEVSIIIDLYRDTLLLQWISILASLHC